MSICGRPPETQDDWTPDAESAAAQSSGVANTVDWTPDGTTEPQARAPRPENPEFSRREGNSGSGREAGVTPEERLRGVTARLRAQAAALPSGEENATPPALDPSAPADRLPAPASVREAAPCALAGGGGGACTGTAPAPRTRLQLEAAEVTARATACSRLRELLADGAWHSALELVEAGGLRYGGRLHEIRRGLDGALPLDVEGEARELNRRALWFYRLARPADQQKLPGNFDSFSGGEHG